MIVCVTDERLIEVYNKYQSIRKTGNALGISHETARYKLKKIGAINKPIRHSCNDNYFAQDTPDAFYWAGFIAADGCVLLKDKKYKRLSIGLAQKDHEHLEKFKSAIEFTGPIAKSSFNHGKYFKSEIKISSVQIFDDLARFNITPRKSLVYTFPDWVAHNKLVNHFMRGYNDGDGSFYNSVRADRKTQLYFSLRGTKDFLNIYNNILETECDFEKHKSPRLNCGIYCLEFGGNIKVRKIRDFLYKGSDKSIQLQRKYNIAFSDQYK